MDHEHRARQPTVLCGAQSADGTREQLIAERAHASLRRLLRTEQGRSEVYDSVQGAESGRGDFVLERFVLERFGQYRPDRCIERFPGFRLDRDEERPERIRCLDQEVRIPRLAAPSVERESDLGLRRPREHAPEIRMRTERGDNLAG
ncbi:MAG TPA: hypothetical protein VIR34_00255 [Gemmatimonadaceae bacterium]